MKIITGMLILLFLVFALVQVNDPDPMVWITIYLMMAAISGAAFLGKLNRYIPIMALIVCIAMMINLWPGLMQWMASADRRLIFDDIAKMQNIYIEEAREFFGLLICSASLFYFFLITRRPQLQD